MKLHLPWSCRTYGAICLLAYLVSSAHELAHHLTGFLTSGQFGRMSFNQFALPENHPHPIPVSLAGPALTCTVAWIGMALLLRGIRPVLGYALVAGSCCYMRLVGVIGGGGDESVISRTLTGAVHRPALILIVAALVLPPILVALHSLGNPNRIWIFIASMFGPFLPLIAVRAIDQRWFVSAVLARESFHLPTVAGIPVAVICADLLMLLLFVLFGLKHLRRSGPPEAFSGLERI